MMDDSTSVRTARVSDADAVAQLTAELGYDVNVTDVRARLSTILTQPGQYFLLAEVDGVTVGWLHAAVAEYIETGRFVMIAGLVVHRSDRRRGVGRKLMEAAERWAGEQGCSIVRLSSTSARIEAHRFYEQLGYRNIKTQYSFAKSLQLTEADELNRLIPRIEASR